MPLFRRNEPPSKWIVRTVLGLVLVSQAAAWFGDLALAGIVDRNPALLIALNPRNRNLLAATNQLDAMVYYTVGFTRLVASDPLYYLLGFWYGAGAITWIERRSRTYGPIIRDGERFFRRAAYPLIFAAPNNIICASAAATGVSLRAFIALNISGTVFRLVVVRQIGEVFASPIDSVIDFIGDNRWPVFIISVVLVAWAVYQEFGQKPMEIPEPVSDDTPVDTATSTSTTTPGSGAGVDVDADDGEPAPGAGPGNDAGSVDNANNAEREGPPRSR